MSLETKPMRILILSSFYPPLERGGYEQMAFEVVQGLMQDGHHVNVLTSRYGVNGNPPTETGVRRTLHLQADVNYYSLKDFFLRRGAQERDNARELRRAIDDFKPDVIFIWNMWDLSRNLPYWAERWLPGRTAYYISATWPSDTDIHIEYWNLRARRRATEWLKRPLRALALGQLRREGYPPKLQFEHAVCVSRFVHNTCASAGQLPPTAGVLYTGIDPEPFLRHAVNFDAPPSDRLRLVYTGALVSIKGVHTAIEALGLLKQRGLVDRVQLTLIGSGHPDYEALLHNLIARYNIAQHVHFAGRVERSEIAQRLSEHDVFLFTSSGPEALARSVMEAMAAGLLVIGAETGGQVEMFEDGRNSLTFKAEDAVGLANQIERVLLDPALRVQLARAGQQTILTRFTLKRMVNDVEAWLQQIQHENTASQSV